MIELLRDDPNVLRPIAYSLIYFALEYSSNTSCPLTAGVCLKHMFNAPLPSPRSLVAP